MSRLSDLLTPRMPAAIQIPESLERAWAWLESRGLGVETEHGYFLTPYQEKECRGVVFSSAASLTGWFEPDEPGFARLVPFADLDGSGGTGVLWLDDAGVIRVGALGSEGQVSQLAENAVDFLRLVAIGYDELVFIDGEPEDEESVDAHADFRNWVSSEFAVEVPAHWAFPEPDPFNAWVNEMKGEEYPTYTS